MKTNYESIFGCNKPICCHCTKQYITNNNLNGAQFNSRHLKNSIITNNGTIKLDTIILSNSNISLLNNGTLKVLKTGTYIVNYYVNINGSDKNTTITISCNGVNCVADNSVQAQITGFAILNLNANDIITIKNKSSQSILLASSDIQVGLIIYTA